MSQQILQQLTKLEQAIEALAERVAAIEQRPERKLDEADRWLASPEGLEAIAQLMPVKRGPGRPRKDASADGRTGT